MNKCRRNNIGFVTVHIIWNLKYNGSLFSFIANLSLIECNVIIKYHYLYYKINDIVCLSSEMKIIVITKNYVVASSYINFIYIIKIEYECIIIVYG